MNDRATPARLAEVDLGPEVPATRITPPHVSRRWLPRPRINARLGVPPDKRLILVISAAGFGKSSCLAAWCRQLTLANVPVAWLTAERPNDDLHTFYAELGAALRRTNLGVGDDVVEIAGRRGRNVSPRLLEDLIVKAIGAQPSPVVLVIDDYHAIAGPEVDEAIAGLLAHAPENLRLVIAGRSAPAIRLGKLRAAGEVLELAPADLAFDLEETRSFLRDRCQIEVPARDVAALLETTEGWPASLQMIAISMRSSTDLRRVLRSAIGQPQLLRRYLREEVMQELPPALRDFLLRTSILDAFNASLAAAVSEVTDSAEMLAEIERRQLFVVSLDDDGQWFRYHHLFGECLRKDLEQTYPHELAELHLRAAEWLAGARRLSEAVRHAMEAKAPERALALVENGAVELVYQGDYLTLTALLKRLPEQRWRQSVKLELAYMWALAYGGVRIETEEILADLVARLPTLTPDEARSVETETKLIRLTIAAFMDRSDHIRRLLSEDPALFASRDPWASDVVNVCASFAHTYAGEHERSREFLSCNHPFKRVYQHLASGVGWWRQGRTRFAENEWNRALEIALSEFGARSISAVSAQCCLAQIQYECGQFEGLELALASRLEFIEEVTATDALAGAVTSLAWSRLARGEPADAEALLNRLRVLGKARGLLRMEALATLELMRLGADHGVGDASHLAQRADEVLKGEEMPSEPSTFREALQCFRLARAFNAALNGFDAGNLDRLHEVVTEFDAQHGVPLAIRARLLLARACVQHGATERATTAAMDAFGRAHDAGMSQTVRDAGHWMRALVPQLFAANEPPTAASAAAAAFEPAPVLADVPPATPSGGGPTEVLSPREKDVLQLVDRGLSNKEIARVLRLEPATVKWHLKNAFSKLGVSNRVQAINRARGSAQIH
ncbi:MAG TPA: LuxR C-terminal-related transcriptional regulator [Burkholderiaceae bacterium]|nr:LuxR C-terminal-related transcriptional regulator [Burkholderiaceae bacterium]